jgi:hypothetical protein
MPGVHILASNVHQRIRCFLAAVVAMAVVTLPASNAVAAVLAGWDFNGQNNWGTSPLAPTTSSTAATVGGLTRGSGVDTSASPVVANAWGGNIWTAPDAAFGVNRNQYVTYAITANTTISLTDIAAYTVGTGNPAFGSGPESGQWQYQLNSGSFTNIGSTITWGTWNSSGNLQSAISLSGYADLQNIAAGNAVTFRIVPFGLNAAGNGSWYLSDFQSGNDLIVNGTIAVPEPSTYAMALAGLACGGYTLFRRRRVR